MWAVPVAVISRVQRVFYDSAWTKLIKYGANPSQVEKRLGTDLLYDIIVSSQCYIDKPEFEHCFARTCFNDAHVGFIVRIRVSVDTGS